MILNYMDYQIKQPARGKKATVFQNGKEILSLSVEGRLSAEELVERVGIAMQKAGLAATSPVGLSN